MLPQCLKVQKRGRGPVWTDGQTRVSEGRSGPTAATRYWTGDFTDTFGWKCLEMKLLTDKMSPESAPFAEWTLDLRLSLLCREQLKVFCVRNLVSVCVKWDLKKCSRLISVSQRARRTWTHQWTWSWLVQSTITEVHPISSWTHPALQSLYGLKNIPFKQNGPSWSSRGRDVWLLVCSVSQTRSDGALF